jgi:putative aldouronate transport system substrate-binding protein
MPQTTDELERVLLAFKNEDPNGNGQADEIALTGSNNGWATDPTIYLMNAFIHTPGLDRVKYLRMDGRSVDLSADEPEWREGLRYMERLVEQGLLDPTAFTQNTLALRALTARDPAVVGMSASGHVREGAREEGIWQEYPVVPPLRGPAGVQSIAFEPSGVQEGRMAITNKASAEVAQRAMEIWDWAFSEEGTLTVGLWGPQDEEQVWRWAEPDERGLNGEPARYSLNYDWVNANATHKHHWHTDVMFWHADLFNGWASNQDISLRSGYERYLVVESDKFIDYAPDRIVPQDLFFTEETARRLAVVQTEVNAYVLQNMLAFITGQKDLENEWDSYVAGLDGLGLDEYLAIMQESYDIAN